MVPLVPLHKSDRQNMADKFLSTVVSQHRLPEYTMNDRAFQFCGHFWDKLVSLLDMKLTFSIVLHP